MGGGAGRDKKLYWMKCKEELFCNTVSLKLVIQNLSILLKQKKIQLMYYFNLNI